jgi:hypothetical protein
LRFGFSAIQRSLDIFIAKLLVDSRTCFADVLPNLKDFELVSTFKNDNKRALHRNIMKMKAGFDRDILITDFATHGTLDDSAMFMLPSSKDKYTLQHFVRFPEGMKLRCQTVPYDMLNVAILMLDQPSYLKDKDLRYLKRATCLQSFQCGSLACEGCTVGNTLTDKLLQYLPPNLLELKIGCSPAFIRPTRCRWPPGLKNLFVKSIKFCAPSVGLLPDSLQYFGVKFSDGCEDEEVHPFSNFDISSLPRGLKTPGSYS